MTGGGMQVQLKHGDILAEDADTLICSANVFLNLSGGVGGEILRRHGTRMQESLHGYLAERHIKFVKQGDIVRTDGFGTGFNHVLHAVAVDGWYRSTAEVIGQLLRKALTEAAALQSHRVALVALGTGYGRLKMNDFALGLYAAVDRDYPPLEIVSVVVWKAEDVEAIQRVLPAAKISQ